MALLLSWLSLGVCALLAVACVVLYFDAKGQRESLAAVRRLADANSQEIAAMRAALAALAPPAPPREAVERRVVSVTRDDDPAHTRATVAAPRSIPAPHDEESKARLRAKWEAEEDARERARTAAALRAAEAGTPDSERRTAQLPPPPVAVPNDRPTVIGGVAPEQRDSDGETRLMELPVGWSKGPIAPKDAANVGRSFSGPWVEETRLSAGTLAKLDRLAAERGTTREAMAADLARTGIEAEELRVAGPTTPPSGPANDAPPPSGKRRT